MEVKELLEKAAKACGIYEASYEGARCGYYLKDGSIGNWNPATDDGDCARMEAALGLDITWYKEWVGVISNHAAADADYKDYPDKQTARRMASLRVAAAIYDSMG